MASMADVSTPFTTRMTEEQMGQYRKRKVALLEHMEQARRRETLAAIEAAQARARSGP